jgi:hypothetical protein
MNRHWLVTDRTRLLELHLLRQSLRPFATRLQVTMTASEVRPPLLSSWGVPSVLPYGLSQIYGLESLGKMRIMMESIANFGNGL